MKVIAFFVLLLILQTAVVCILLKNEEKAQAKVMLVQATESGENWANDDLIAVTDSFAKDNSTKLQRQEKGAESKMVLQQRREEVLNKAKDVEDNVKEASTSFQEEEEEEEEEATSQKAAEEAAVESLEFQQQQEASKQAAQEAPVKTEDVADNGKEPAASFQQQEEAMKTKAAEKEQEEAMSKKIAVKTVDVADNVNPDVFDPKLTAEDYEFLKPSPPTDKWLESCADSLSNDKIINKPFHPVIDGMYRLGDCIKFCRACGRHGGTTLAEMYKKLGCQAGNGEKNLTVVKQIFEKVSRRPKFVSPDPEAVVIHLRLGDVFESASGSTAHLLKHGGVNGAHRFQRERKVRTIWPFREYLELINDVKANTVVLVGGSHEPQLFEKSKVYAHCVQRGLAKSGKQVELRIDDGDADKDFYYMSHAKYFVQSTGGYSRLIGEMVDQLGGQRLGGTEDWRRRFLRKNISFGNPRE